MIDVKREIAALELFIFEFSTDQSISYKPVSTNEFDLSRILFRQLISEIAGILIHFSKAPHSQKKEPACISS